MTLLGMSSILSMPIKTLSVLVCLVVLLTACDLTSLNNPYVGENTAGSVLYSSFSERPKHLDPAVSYNSNEYTFIGQIYEPPLQYHYLKRPYELIPLTTTKMPTVVYRDKAGKPLPENAAIQDIAFTDYILDIKPSIQFQPHPALAKDNNGIYLYHHLSLKQLEDLSSIGDFKATGSRELTAEDYVYQIKRLANPKIQSPIAGVMQPYIVGFEDFAKQLSAAPQTDLKTISMQGVKALNRYQYQITINGKYPQFRFWLAMQFFAPMPWEADVFYAQPGLKAKNISLDWFPIGTGPYQLTENNPNRQMVLLKNPLFHGERYPDSGEAKDKALGLLHDAGKPLPFIDKVVYILEKETIPYWNKFLQGYYDASGIASDSFDQAIQFAGNGQAQLTPAMQAQGMRLQTEVQTSSFYMGFNMLDNVVGGDSERARKLRQAIAIAIDYEEYISIFTNGRGVAAQGLLPPGIYGNQEGQAGMNPYVYDWVNTAYQRKSLTVAKQLMTEAGYTNGIDPATGQSLILYFDSTSVSTEDRPMLNWYRKQFEKLGIKLVVRATDYNRFQQKMRDGNAQIFVWGWNADYPDPENFFFLLYGPNGKAKHGGENAGNYHNPQFDKLFEQMRNMDNGENRMQLIQQLQEQIRHDAPWVFGYHPKGFALFHGWYLNSKANLMANNKLKYLRIDSAARDAKRQAWNRPNFWPLLVGLVLLIILLVPAIIAYRRRASATLQITQHRQQDIPS
ncbi:MAG: ABC transporter substrate-binding protein [Methylococcaceae bacterium]|nr:ABC transporter substrate-binding protein [Methylococcaceae bacterium]